MQLTRNRGTIIHLISSRCQHGGRAHGLLSPDQEAFEGLGEFYVDFTVFRSLYERLETEREGIEALDLLRRGEQVEHGGRRWTKDDLEDVFRWKNRQPLLPKIEKEAPDVEKRLAYAFEINDEEEKIDALCRIPFIGPVLTSILLTLTYPTEYAPLDSHSWNGLCSLGFDLSKRPFSGGGYSVHELLRYLSIVRSLAKQMKTPPWDVAKALHALDQVNTKTKWKRAFDTLKSSPALRPHLFLA